MNTPSKFFLNFSKILAPSHVAMGRSIMSAVNYTPRSFYSQRLPQSGLETYVMKLVQNTGVCYIDENGDLLSAKDRNHYHSVVKTPDGRIVSIGLYTRHPQNKNVVINAVDLGPGTIEYPNSFKNQYIGFKTQPYEITQGYSEANNSDTFLEECRRLSQIEPEIEAQNLLTKSPTKIYQLIFKNPEIHKNSIYIDNKENKAFRELVSKQFLEQLKTGQDKDDHLFTIANYIKSK